MNKKLLKSILLIITYTVVLVMVLARLDVVGGVLGALLGVLRPIILGFALAFVLNRPCRFFLRLYNRGLGRTRARRAVQPLAVLTSYLALILAVAALVGFVVPRLITSIQLFASSLEGYVGSLQTWSNDLLEKIHLSGLDLSGLNSGLQDLLDRLAEWLSTLGPWLVQLAGNIISAVVTGVLALVFSVYMLSGRDRLLRQFSRLLRAYIPPRIAAPLFRIIHLTADTFTNFITGQLLEACTLR